MKLLCFFLISNQNTSMKTLEEVIDIYTLSNNLTEELQKYKTQAMIEMYMRMKSKILKEIEATTKKMDKVTEEANTYIGGDAETEEVVEDTEEETLSTEEKDLVYGYNIIESLRQYKNLEFKLEGLKKQLEFIKNALEEEKSNL